MIIFIISSGFNFYWTIKEFCKRSTLEFNAPVQCDRQSVQIFFFILWENLLLVTAENSLFCPVKVGTFHCSLKSEVVMILLSQKMVFWRIINDKMRKAMPSIESQNQSVQPQSPLERHRSEQPKCPKDIISHACKDIISHVCKDIRGSIGETQQHAC